MRLLRVFYVSAITTPISATEMQVILGQAQIRNRRLDITGMIVRSDGHFCQMLEGRSEAVLAMLSVIRADRRHEAVRVLVEEAADVRLFANWAMGLVIRDDLASEMRALHEATAPQEDALRSMIARLLGDAVKW